MATTRALRQGFTLIELLVVISILAILAGILFPVFMSIREKGRQTNCLSNEKQLGLSILQYVQDNDERFPNGVQRNGSDYVWQGEGWAGQCSAYIKNAAILRCPTDVSISRFLNDFTVSYGYNINLIKSPAGDDDELPGLNMAQLTASSKTVLLFEVSNIFANVLDPREGSENGFLGTNFSASGNGLDHRLYAQKTFVTSTDNQYATGFLGGRIPPDPTDTQFESITGRHTHGSNFLLADGHAHWLSGDHVSSGLNASAAGCSQDNIPAFSGCSGPFTAAGTDRTEGATAATFSVL